MLTAAALKTLHLSAHPSAKFLLTSSISLAAPMLLVPSCLFLPHRGPLYPTSATCRALETSYCALQLLWLPATTIQSISFQTQGGVLPKGEEEVNSGNSSQHLSASPVPHPHCSHGKSTSLEKRSVPPLGTPCSRLAVTASCSASVN